MATKAKLVSYLDKHVFEPILKAKPDGRSEKEQRQLEDVQRRTEAERARFHGYDTAERVVAMYKDDLTSDKARSVNAHLKALRLPILADVREDFVKLAGEGS